MHFKINVIMKQMHVIINVKMHLMHFKINVVMKLMHVIINVKMKQMNGPKATCYWRIVCKP